MLTRISMGLLVFICLFLLEESIYGQSSVQTLRGIVMDQNTEIPLIGATVLVSSSSYSIGLITDGNGIFRVENIPIGRYYIEVSYIGYEPKGIAEVLISSSRPSVVDIRLAESLSEIGEVEIKAQPRKDIPINLMAMVSARTFTVEETRRFAGGFDDPGRMAAAFAGVAGGSPNDNALSIRGNAPKSLVWRIEGVSVPNPNHFPGMLVEGGGILSLLSGQMLNNSDFFTGAFPAEYGNSLSGVFDMNLRAGDNEERVWGIQVGTLGIDGFGEGPLVKGKSASYLFNYRYSTTAILKDLIPEGQLPIFQDLSFKLNFPTKKAGTFSIWGLGGLDQNGSEPLEDSSQWNSVWDQSRYRWIGKTGILSAKHKVTLGSKTFLNTSLTASLNQFSDTEDFLERDGSYTEYRSAESSTSLFSISSVVTHKFNHHISNRSGMVLSRIAYDLIIRRADSPGDEPIEYGNEDGSTEYLQSFSQFKWRINNNVTLNAGIHSMLFLLNNNKTLEPRAGVSYTFLNGNNVSFAYGNHSLVEPLTVYFYKYESMAGDIRSPNRDLSLTRSNHYVLSYNWLLAEKLRLSAELYYQDLYNIPVDPGGLYSLVNYKQEYLITDSLSNEGSGTNRGFDLTLERFLFKNYYFLATGSLIDSKYTAGDGKIYNSRWDYGYVFNLLAGREFLLGPAKDKILGINGRVVFQGGERTHPVDLARSIEEQQVVYDYDRAWEARFPNTYYIDFTATLSITRAKYTSIWGIQVKNLLLENSIFYQRFNEERQEIEIDGSGFIFPNISYKIVF